MGFPGGSSGKEPAIQCRRHKRRRFNPWVGKIHWRRKWQPTPVFLPREFIPRTEEPGGLQSIGLQRVGHNWSNCSWGFEVNVSITSQLNPLTYFLHFVPSWSWMESKELEGKNEDKQRALISYKLHSHFRVVVNHFGQPYWVFRISFSFILCYRKIIKTDISAFPNSFIIIRMKSNHFWQKIKIRT